MISKKIPDILKHLGFSFHNALNLSEKEYLEGIADRKGSLEQLLPFRNWDWTQGVGLFGLWRLFLLTGEGNYYDQIFDYYNRYLETELPGKNINSICPMFTMTLLWEYSKDDRYKPYIEEWAAWIMEDLPRTDEGGFQHITAEYQNDQELWVDTLFMSLLFLTKAGLLLGKDTYVREAEYQFLLHIKFLTDRRTGLLFHGWSFADRNHFSGALWCRGNCWLTLAIPVFLSFYEPPFPVKRFLLESLKNQINALEKFQSESGLWHTLLDHEDSYCEVSGSAGIAAGILMSVRLGILDGGNRATGLKAMEALVENIGEDGTIGNVSIGTPVGRTDLDFYKNIECASMPYGPALMILYLIEIMEIKSGNGEGSFVGGGQTGESNNYQFRSRSYAV